MIPDREEEEDGVHWVQLWWYELESLQNYWPFVIQMFDLMNIDFICSYIYDW